MTHFLTSRHDITLNLVRDVAWRGEALAVADVTLDDIDKQREAFLAFVRCDSDARVYGVNQGQGEMIAEAMDEADRERLARLKPLAAAVPFGEPYPERVVRAMVLARFANLLEGHGTGSVRLVQALAAMLNEGPLPKVPQKGQGGPGEILVLYTLFADLAQSLDLEPGERGALINGAPAAAAVLADAALVGERRLALAERVLALAIVAFNAPAEHYEPVVGTLLGGAHNETAFNNLAALLDGMTNGVAARDHQAPVGYRIVPHVLGQAHAAVEQAHLMATQSLSAVTHNPIYLAPEAAGGYGRSLSTGGYHNAVAAPAMDQIAGACADLCLVCLRLCVGLLNGRVSGYPDFLLSGRKAGESDGHGAVGYLPMAITGFMEEARAAATRTFIPASDASVFGQDDVTAPAFLAWPKTMAAGASMEACLAVTAVAASQALHVTGRTQIPAPLTGLLDDVRHHVRTVEGDRVLGPDLGALTNHLRAGVFTDDHNSDGSGR
ncbi:MAG: histidine ammonia-lyase [Rhodospirillaceae bacterium]|nr:histidine ammonia-lyase [Rhodospirillaceae bacterium]